MDQKSSHQPQQQQHQQAQQPSTTLHNVTVTVTEPARPEREQVLTWTSVSAVGSGSFGVVYRAVLQPSGEQVAIKRVNLDPRFKNRELAVLKAVNGHPNVIRMLGYFYTPSDRRDGSGRDGSQSQQQQQQGGGGGGRGGSSSRDSINLNVVMEFMDSTIYRVVRNFWRQRQHAPMFFIRLYMYQLFRSLAYIHALGICHRDIKPQNLLVGTTDGVLKLCDFGSAKRLVPGEPNVAYICSRYYRAPELIFGATNYTTQIDIWSSGCVMAELMLGAPIFPGDSSIDQLVEIIKILGTPTRDQIRALNPAYIDHRFPQIHAHTLSRMFSTRMPESAIKLLEKLLDYTPSLRFSAIEAMADPFFDELRAPGATLPNDKPMPPLFNFSALELSIRPDLIPKLVPPHARQALREQQGIDLATFVPIPPEQFPRPPLE
ncbi:Pkinase-domain-containing protein [Ramicandelaber brevisporus]|nr:Pkinase-domain-containing protein [Ramicandelaber brevisporus]